MRREEGRKPKTINIGKCQDTRRRPIYTTTISYRDLLLLKLSLFIILFKKNYKKIIPCTDNLRP
jgi:hypothetical protein